MYVNQGLSRKQNLSQPKGRSVRESSTHNGVSRVNRDECGLVGARRPVTSSRLREHGEVRSQVISLPGGKAAKDKEWIWRAGVVGRRMLVSWYTLVHFSILNQNLLSES